MSTKTLRKRVALIAVSAMGFGLISGVTPANAAPGDISYNSANSQGVLASAGITAGTDSVATMLTTGSLALNVAAGGATATKLVVSAGAYISSSSVVDSIAANQLSVTGSAGASTYAVIKTTLPAGSTFTATSYASTATGAAVVSVTTVTVAGSSVAGTVVPANSFLTWTAVNGDRGDGIDSATGSETTTGNKLNMNIRLRDAYKADITSTTGALVVTASTGAVVAISTDANAVATTSTYATAVSAASPADLNVQIAEATAGAGWSGTVTVTYNGTVIGTKSGKITGVASKLVLTALKVGKNNGSANAKSLSFTATDAAGNAVTVAHTAVVFGDSTKPSIVSTAAGTVTQTTTDPGYAAFTCVSGATGSSDIYLQTTLSNGTTIKSNTVTVLCGGAADTYKVAFDKAKYNQGDIATLTVSFKDAKGAVANSYDSVTSTNGAKDSISSPMMKQIVALNGTELADANGNLVIKFNVGDVSSFSAGKYNAVVALVSSASATYGANYAAQTAGYEITGSGGVSNSDILASIVKLITAINKQIAALQKLLLKK
jgi:hypothetical protein